METFEKKRDKSVRIIKSVLSTLDMNVREFAESIGANYMQVYYITVGKTKTISDALVDMIVARYPYISRHFLETGEGSVLPSDDEPVEMPQPQASVPRPVSMEEMYKMIDRVLSYLDKVQAREEHLDKMLERTLALQEAMAAKLGLIDDTKPDNPNNCNRFIVGTRS